MKEVKKISKVDIEDIELEKRIVVRDEVEEKMVDRCEGRFSVEEIIKSWRKRIVVNEELK